MAICAGVGGLELGLRLALGDDYQCAVYIEREAYAAATLVARMEEQALDPAPIWDDVVTFDGRPWRGVVDLITAGFPCQPWSVAGRRQKTDDERWIWDDIARVICEVGSGIVFLENVPGLVHGGLEHVLGDLATFGFTAEWDVFSAAETGAPHLRERLFILAHSDIGKLRQQPQRLAQCGDADGAALSRDSMADTGDGLVSESERRSPARDGARPTGPKLVDTASRGIRRRGSSRDSGLVTQSGQELADSDSCRRQPAVGSHDAWEPVAYGGKCDVADSNDTGRQEQRRPLSVGTQHVAAQCGGDDVANSDGHGQSQFRGERGKERDPDGRDGPLFPPGRSARVTEWQAWLDAAPGTEPAIRRGADGLAYRMDRLRVGGNGVVPVVAAVAFLHLRDRLLGPMK